MKINGKTKPMIILRDTKKLHNIKLQSKKQEYVEENSAKKFMKQEELEKYLTY